MTTMVAQRMGIEPETVREDLLHAEADDVWRRRATVGLSLLGVAAMTPVAMLQTGIVRHLPDPHVGRFNSDKANLSDSAFQFGVPDGTLALASLAANIPLAACGARDRTRKQPWIPLLAAGKALLDAAGAGWYFFQMASKREPWCPYCITGAIANFGVAALTLPEATKALRQLSK